MTRTDTQMLSPAKRMLFRLTLTTVLLASPGAAQRPELSFEFSVGKDKVMTRADFPAKYLLLVYQGVP